MGLRLFRNARIYTPGDPGKAAAGRAQAEVAAYIPGALLCRDGRIVTVGDEGAVLGALGDPGRRTLESETDCRGLCMVPGFVDPHTHLCFTRPRESEFSQRLEGADYLDILRKGGGILSSVAAVRAAAPAELYAATRRRALSALSLGTTTIEIKTGYGLDVDNELKQLAAIRRLGEETALSVIPTFMAAHAVPPEFEGRPDDYVEAVIAMLPEARRAGALFCDVFCEQGVFSPEQSRKILEAAASAGMGVKMHADELHETWGRAAGRIALRGIGGPSPGRLRRGYSRPGNSGFRRGAPAGDRIQHAAAVCPRAQDDRNRAARGDRHGLQPWLVLRRVDALCVRAFRDDDGPFGERGARCLHLECSICRREGARGGESHPREGGRFSPPRRGIARGPCIPRGNLTGRRCLQGRRAGRARRPGFG